MRQRTGRGRHVLLGPIPHQQRPAPAFDVDGGLAVDQGDHGARLPPGPVGDVRPASGGQGRAAPYALAGIGGGQRRRPRRRDVAATAGWALVGPQPVDGGRQRELRGTQPLDGVDATAAAGVLEGREHAVDGREAADDALGHDRAAGDDAVPVEEGLTDRARPSGSDRRWVRQQRPAARRGRRTGPGRQAGATAPPDGSCGRAADAGPQRRPPVVGDPAGPHQTPQRLDEVGVRRDRSTTGPPTPTRSAISRKNCAPPAARRRDDGVQPRDRSRDRRRADADRRPGRRAPGTPRRPRRRAPTRPTTPRPRSRSARRACRRARRRRGPGRTARSQVLAGRAVPASCSMTS